MTTSSAPASVDLVTLNVVYNRLVGICREMGTTMMRTAYSPIFSESRDFSCVLFDRQGRMLAQTEFCPAQVGAIRFVVKWLIAEIGEENVREGDIIVHNDPLPGRRPHAGARGHQAGLLRRRDLRLRLEHRPSG